MENIMIANNKHISYAGPSITEEDAEFVKQAVLNGFYENYKTYVQQLERTFADYIGVKYAIATPNCTTALHLSLAALDIKPGDEVIVTDLSCVATAFPIHYLGATAIFVDVDKNSMCIDPQKILEAISSKTKAIMAVHYLGHPAAMDEIMTISKSYNLPVVEDAAAAVGTRFKGEKVGKFGNCAAFSFQGAKVAVSGEGGILVADDQSLYERAHLLANLGRNDRECLYWSDEAGFKYTMPNLTAALALSQMKRVDELVDKKRRIFSQYYERLNGLEQLKVHSEEEGCFSNYCYPAVSLTPESKITRNELLNQLLAEGIDSRPVQPRMSPMPMFQQRYDNPTAEYLDKNAFILPSAAKLSSEDIDFVCDNIIKFLKG
jgi:perosamine synthetase